MNKYSLIVFAACFDMFDADHDGMLNGDELKNMVDGLLEVYKQYDDV